MDEFEIILQEVAAAISQNAETCAACQGKGFLKPRFQIRGFRSKKIKCEMCGGSGKWVDPMHIIGQVCGMCLVSARIAQNLNQWDHAHQLVQRGAEYFGRAVEGLLDGSVIKEIEEKARKMGIDLGPLEAPRIGALSPEELRELMEDNDNE